MFEAAKMECEELLREATPLVIAVERAMRSFRAVGITLPEEPPEPHGEGSQADAAAPWSPAS